MTPAGTIRVALEGAVGKFRLDAAFTAPATGVTALFGPSGSGKTTVLRCIAGLLRLPDGFCSVDGEVWQDKDGTFVPTYRRPLGYVFQEPSLFPHLSVRHNLLFGAPRAHRAAAALGDRGGAVSDRANTRGGDVVGRSVDFDEVVDLLRLAPLLDRSPRNLSGGERQRAAIGRALVSQPKLLLMDEPLAALDRAAKDEIASLIERLRDRHLLPIVYISHDIAEVERVADHVVLMEKGKVGASGSLSDVESDLSLPLARAFDAGVSLDGVVEAYDRAYGLLTLSVSGGRFVSPGPASTIGEQRRIRIVARDVSLARERPGPSSILNILPARIVSIRQVDLNEIVASLALGEEGTGARLLARLTRKSWDGLELAVGVRVYAQVKAAALGPRRDASD